MRSIPLYVFPFLDHQELFNVLQDDTNLMTVEWCQALSNILNCKLMQELIDKAIGTHNYDQVNKYKILFIRFGSVLTKQIKSLLELALTCPDETR